MRSKFAWLVAAGLTTYAVSAQEVGTRLPNGVTLLGADSAPCADTLVIEPRGENADDELARIRAGQFVVLEVDDPGVPWVCLGDSSRSDTMECPADTTHVRISRSIDDDVVLFECFGR
jgi:hypothetical protein